MLQNWSTFSDLGFIFKVVGGQNLSKISIFVACEHDNTKSIRPICYSTLLLQCRIMALAENPSLYRLAVEAFFKHSDVFWFIERAAR